MIPRSTLSIRPYRLIFLFLAMVSPAIGASVPDPGYWDAVFELGYDPKTGRASDEHACRRIEMVYEFSRLVSEHGEVDRELTATYHDMRSMLSSLDAGNLYDLLPYSDNRDQWRAIGISGQLRMNSYRLSQYDPGTGQESTLGLQTDRELPVGLHHFGDFDFRAFIRPVANNTYRFITDLEINTADLSAVILPRIVSGLSGVSWEHAVGPADGSPAYLERKFPLNQPSLKVLEGFAAEFPDFFKTITKYLEIDSIISSLSPNPDGPHITDFRVRINRNTIAKKYPEIGAVFEKLKGMVYFTGRFFDNQDRLMGFVELDSADDLFVLQFRTLNGRFLPLVGSQPPDNSTGISLTDQASLQLYAEFDIHLNIVGLHLDVASLEVPIAYSFSDRVVDLKACLLQPPDAVAAEGRAFGFLPLWLIDILIPSNVEKITSDFFQVLAMGNDGQGGRIEFMGLPQAPSRNSLVITADGETLANGTIKLGFNLQRRLAKDQQELIAEIRAFKSELLRAFYLDYQKIKKKRGCQ